MINKKGMTLVELIVTFSLVLVVVVGFYNLILDVKFQLDEKQMAKELTEFSSQMNHKIHYNLINTKISDIAVFNKDGNKVYNNSTTLNASSCNNLFPCVLYKEDTSSTRVIAFNNRHSGSDPVFKNYGILFGNVNKPEFVAMPHSAYVDSMYNGEQAHSIEVSCDGSFLKIKYPIYLKDSNSTKDYGFLIYTPVKIETS